MGKQLKKVDYKTDGRVVLLRLNDPPLNLLTFDMLNALSAAIDRANDDPRIIGIVIAGSDEHFSAGADINLFRSMPSHDEAISISRRFQETFDHIEESEKPVCAAVAGQVTGGALELALAAHYRVCSAGTRFAFPEVNLGIIPAAGGTQRLPRTIGTAAALDMLLSGRPVEAEKAISIGLVDALCAPCELVNTAQKLVMPGKKPLACSMRTDKIDNAAVNSEALEQASRKASSFHREIIAPVKIIEALTAGINGSYKDGLIREQTGFAECMASAAARNKIYVFFASRTTTKIPDLDSVKPSPIAATAVIGMGSMGSGIAQAFATSGMKVLVMDVDVQMAEKGVSRIAESLERKIRRGASTKERKDAIMEKISIAKSLEDLAAVDLVIEAVFEDVGLKQSLLGKIGGICRPQTLIATNTSTIDLDVLAEKLPMADRFLGLHFFNPAHSMPLVEVIRRPTTSREAVATAIKFIKDLHKTPVLVNNSVGFVLNRIFIPYLIEAFGLLEEGAAPREIDAAMVEFGFPMGPLEVCDLAGIDILLFTDKIMRSAYPFHIPLSSIADAMAKEGLLGQKTGCGIYRYETDQRTPMHSDRTEAIIGSIRRNCGRRSRSFTSSQIVERLIFRMVSEGFRVAGEGIAIRESDIDVAMILGTGFPDFRGGVLKYARDIGLREVSAKLSKLADEYGERYQPCNYLKSNIKES